MFNVNLSFIALGLGGCFCYVYSMSALGRMLAACREATSMPYPASAANRTLRA